MERGFKLLYLMSFAHWQHYEWFDCDLFVHITNGPDSEILFPYTHLGVIFSRDCMLSHVCSCVILLGVLSSVSPTV